MGLPAGILLTLFSTRVGTVAGRIGARRFLVIGPLFMAAGLAWISRIARTVRRGCSTSGPGMVWPPTDLFIDVLPAVVLFGVGITLVVAPLTTTLMGSVPMANAGLGSAINNAVSRVGSPLLLAMLYLVITLVFYGSLDRTQPSMDTDSNAVRAVVQPLNPPPAGTDPQTAIAIDQASTEAFRLAMLIDAGLLLLGATVNGFGLRRRRAQSTEADRPPVRRGCRCRGSEPVDVLDRYGRAAQERGNDPLREVTVELATEQQPEVDRPHQQLRDDAGIRVRAQVAPLDATGNDPLHLGATRLHDGRPEPVAETRIHRDLRHQGPDDRPEGRLRQRPDGVHDAPASSSWRVSPVSATAMCGPASSTSSSSASSSRDAQCR